MEDEMGHSNDDCPVPLPPGYRFSPDNQQLIAYLQTRVTGGYILPGVFHDVNIYKHTPQQLYERYGREGQEATYFFSPRSKKYRKGPRPDRTVRIEPNECIPDGKVGFWKSTGKDQSVCFKGIVIGTKRNLAYFEGKANDNEKKTNWLMQEFMLINAPRNNTAAADERTMHLDDWVLCKIYYYGRSTGKKRMASHGDTERQGVQNSNVRQLRSQPRPMDHYGRLAAYISLNNINVENSLMALAAAAGNSNHIGLMRRQDDGSVMNMPPVQHDNLMHPMHDALMLPPPPSSSSSSSSTQEEAEMNNYSVYPFSVPPFMQLHNESVMPRSDTTDSTSADAGKGGV